MPIEHIPLKGQGDHPGGDLHDWLDAERRAGRWDGNAPPPTLPDMVVDATSRRYLDAFEKITGAPLEAENLA